MKPEKLLKAMPVTVFYMVAGVNLLLMFGGFSDEAFKRCFYILNEVFGNSLIFNSVLLLICVKYRLKTYSYLAASALILMNFVNLSFMLLPIGWSAYLELSLLGVIVPFMALITGFVIKKI